MREIACQIRDQKLYPFSEEDIEILREYKPNQIVKIKIQGVRRPRSYRQLKLYWAGCKLTAENTDDPNWNTKEKVDFQCRVLTHFVDPSVVAVKFDGTVAFSYRSIAFANLKHIEACNWFQQAFDVMAKFLQIPVDVLIEQIISQ